MNRHGMTLMELIVAMAIVGIFTVLTIQIGSSFYSGVNKISNQTGLDNELNILLSQVSLAISEFDGTNLPTWANPALGGLPTWANPVGSGTSTVNCPQVTLPGGLSTPTYSQLTTFMNSPTGTSQSVVFQTTCVPAPSAQQGGPTYYCTSGNIPKVSVNTTPDTTNSAVNVTSVFPASGNGLGASLCFLPLTVTTNGYTSPTGIQAIAQGLYTAQPNSTAILTLNKQKLLNLALPSGVQVLNSATSFGSLYRLASHSAPATVTAGATYSVVCNWGISMPCGWASNPVGGCSYTGTDSSGNLSFTCTAPTTHGTPLQNFCGTSVFGGDPKCSFVQSFATDVTTTQ